MIIYQEFQAHLDNQILCSLIISPFTTVVENESWLRVGGWHTFAPEQKLCWLREWHTFGPVT